MPRPHGPAPPYRADRVYLLPGEVLHGADCPTCSQIAQSIKNEGIPRRYIPVAVLESPQVVSHLEHDVLGRVLDLGDPNLLAQLPLSE
jgi:hypothetical protein